MSSVAENLQQVLTSMEESCRIAGRATDEVRLMAVSKTKPAELVAEAVHAGQCLFGENRVQELVQKKPLLPSRLRWHLIGPLQSNKVRKAVQAADRLDAVHSLEILQDINRIGTELGREVGVLLEVNVAAEASKHGFGPQQLDSCFEQILAMRHVRVEGLMCIPPPVSQVDDARPHFARLRLLCDELQAKWGLPLPELSMGMSHDFSAAIAEGSTLVRVGSAIFGNRSAVEAS